jgi:hypothetical protein
MALFGPGETQIQGINMVFGDAPISITIDNINVNSEDKDYLEVTVSVTNDSTEYLDDCLIGFEFISVFKEYMEYQGGFSGLDIKPGKRKELKWKFFIDTAEQVGHVVAYPFKTRLKSGEIWIGNRSEVKAQIKSRFETILELGDIDKRPK